MQFKYIVIILSLFVVGGCCNLHYVQPTHKFPKDVVGVWEAQVGEMDKWGFKFESDGTISKIVHSVFGPINIAQKGVYQDGPDPNTFLAVQLGDCVADYNEISNILSVRVVVDSYTMALPQGEISGRIEDVIIGKVDLKTKVWNANWWNYGELEGGQKPDKDLIMKNPEKLLFHKLNFSSNRKT